MKYIIDIPDNSDTEYTYDQDTKELKFPSPRIDPTSFMGLEIVLTNVIPYIELDREAIENEVANFWKTVKDMDADTLDKIFEEMNFWAILNSMSYQEAKTRHKAWGKKEQKTYNIL